MHDAWSKQSVYPLANFSDEDWETDRYLISDLFSLFRLENLYRSQIPSAIIHAFSTVQCNQEIDQSGSNFEEHLHNGINRSTFFDWVPNYSVKEHLSLITEAQNLNWSDQWIQEFTADVIMPAYYLWRTKVCLCPLSNQEPDSTLVVKWSTSAC